MRTQPTRIILVTSTSRGVGAEVAHQFAAADTHVVVNYRENTRRAESIAADVRAAGGHASTLAADITGEAGTAAMFATINARFGRLDALVVNVSDPRHALHLDRAAHRRLVSQALPVMPPGGRIVFATNHQAHFFPNKAVPKGCAALAASTRAGETALYTMRSEFARAGIRFTVVSGDMADGAGEFAAAIVKSATTSSLSGVVYVGSANYQMTA